MNKKLIISGLVLVCLVGLLFVVRANKSQQTEPEENNNPITEAKTFNLVNYDKENVEKIIVEQASGNVEYICNDEIWQLADVDNSVLNVGNIDFNVSAMLQLNSAQLITDSPESLGSFGLETPSATLNIMLKDGNVAKLYLGDKTADGNYYYVTVDNKNIYTLDKQNGTRILYTYKDFANLSMDSLAKESITLVQVVEGDKELYIEFDSKDVNANENLKKSGVTTLSMKKPIENLLVYPNNLQTGLLYNLNGVVLNSLVEIAPTDLARYGLDNPHLTFKLADIDNAYIVKVGNEADADNYYVQINTRNAVYTMSKSAVEPFKNYKIVDFIQKFLALHTRSDVAKVTVESVYGNYAVDFRAEGENDIKVVEGTRKDGRNTYINDKPVDRDTFIVFYELLTGLTFDDIKEEKLEKGEKQATITYDLMDGTQDIVNFYNYNENFFVAEKGDNSLNYGLLVSKQRVKQIADRAGEVSK